MIKKLRSLWITFRFKMILWRGVVADILNSIGMEPNCTTTPAGEKSYGYGKASNQGIWDYQLRCEPPDTAKMFKGLAYHDDLEGDIY
jgi:hypothetical protein